jgi:ABC-type multidrug transport system fused ATPase/permease subunit
VVFTFCMPLQEAGRGCLPCLPCIVFLVTGRITLDGVDFRDINLYSLHHQFAVVAQDTELFAGTVKENIVYGMSEDSWDEAALIEATKAASAHDFIMSFEDGQSLLCL